MSPREHLILCGQGAKPPATAKAWQRAKPIPLDTTPGTGNVHLQIRDITDRMVSRLPEVAEDLIELASYVYAADQASERGDLSRFDYGREWRRRFHFEVPVRRPDVWSDPRIMDELVRTLSFLSDDDYEFRFRPLKKATRLPEYLEYTHGTDEAKGVQEVVLFSGGLDSLAGVVQEVLVNRRKVALVSHRPVTKVESRQTRLKELITGRAQAGARPFHVPVLVNKKTWLGKDFTQRTRSFLFSAFAAVIARLFDLDRVRFYENGIVSCNLPISAQVLGGRASRTTHPLVLNGFGRLVGLLFGNAFTFENPFFWKTRTGVIEGLRASGHADLSASSVSCVRTLQASTDQPHCGTCSQCVDRRLAALAAGLSDAEDPAQRYQVQLLTGHLEDVLEQTMVERIVGTAREVEALAGPLQFAQRFGEVSRLLRQLPGRADEVVVDLFKLHREHARQVNSVVARELAAGFKRGSFADLPPTCLLRVLAGRMPGHPTGGAPSGREGSDPSPHKPTKDDWRILKALAKTPHTLLRPDLRERLNPKPSLRTLGKRLDILLRYQLVHYPNGARSGVALAGAGKALLDHAPQRRRPSRAR